MVVKWETGPATKVNDTAAPSRFWQLCNPALQTLKPAACVAQVWAVDASWEHGTFSPDELAIVERANVPSYYGRVQVGSHHLLCI